MLRPYLKIWEWELIFGRAVKAISSVVSDVDHPDHCGGLTQVLAESIMLSKLTDHKNHVFGRQFHSAYIYFMFNTIPVRSTFVGQL